MSTEVDIIEVLDADEQEIAQSIVTAAEPLVEKAHAVTVTTDQEAEDATNFLSVIAGEKKRATEARRFLVDPLNAHVNAINKRFKRPAAILDEADKIVRGKVLAYRQERERARQAEIRRRQEAAEAVARAEREEQQRRETVAREQAARAAEAARQAEEAAAAGAAEQASAAAAREFAAATAALQQQRASMPVPVAEPVRAPLPMRTLGAAASRKRWVATVVNPALVPREYLVVDQRLVNAAVKNGARRIPGVRIEHVEELAVRPS